MKVLLLCLFSLLHFSKDSIAAENYGGPVFDLVRPVSGYHGLVDEDEVRVDVQPVIRATPNVCGFRVVNRHHGEVPFVINLKDSETGEAQLMAKWTLNCEKRKNYKFDIVARSCDGLTSDNVTVHVKVNDVNEFAPVFVEPSYVVAVDEGRVYDEILTLQADDQDCSPKYGDICRYELLTPDQPFHIDGEGVVRNTAPLEYEKSHNHILSVVAYDCGMKRSQPVMVTVKVNRVCHLGWKNIPNQIEYSPNSGRQELFPSASLQLCQVPCKAQRVRARVSLTTDHIGKGCDRDTYAVSAQRRMCGANTASIELLPSPGAGKEWTAGLHSDEGREGDLIYRFEGDYSAALLPDNILPHNLTSTFTISTWLKHKPNTDQDKHRKEHVICAADDHKMNRHHMSLFVRNCRLIFLLRREFTQQNLNTFQPAEWRWKLDQVCDNEWHHYSVQVKLPEVILYLDGHPYRPLNGQSPEIIDDWPLHPTRGIKTTVGIGGCWQGSENRMKHGLDGYMAGLNVIVGDVESPRVLACLTRCQEALDTPAMELLQPSMELLTNNEMTQITIEGNNVTNLEALIRKVAYVNSRDYPTPGKRPVSIVTNIGCEDSKALKIGSSSSFVVVVPPHRPTIQINGTANFAKEYTSFREGLRIFPDVALYTTLQAHQQEILNTDPDVNSLPGLSTLPEGQLDQCVVAVYPPLNPDHETLVLPDSLIAELGLAATITRRGASISGTDSTAHYQAILRYIRYANRKPAYYLNRAFKLTCSELGGRFNSNEYVQTVTVTHPQLASSDAANKDAGNLDNPAGPGPVSDSHSHPIAGALEPAGDFEGENNAGKEDVVHIKQAGAVPAAHAKIDTQHVQIAPAIVKNVVDGSAGHAVTIIIVVCIGFLAFMVVLGVVRIRAARHRSGHDHSADTEMAWDDSPLNITVNPMDLLEREERKRASHMDDDADDQDDSCSSSEEEGGQYEHDLESSEDEGGSPSDTKQLHWDDSNLKI